MTGKAIVFAMVLGCCVGTGTAMQQGSQGSVPAPEPYDPSNDSAKTGRLDDGHYRMLLEQMKLANLDRQKRMTREAGELLNAAGELRLKAQHYDGTKSQAEMLRQIELIEKLAHNVKERMKGAR